MIPTKHHGRNMRSIRLLLGMKQELFAWKMGITQQYVSKLERQSMIAPEKLEAAAKVLGVSVAAIENFNENNILHNPTDQEPDPAVIPAKEVIDYFKEELARKDRLIDQLQLELEAWRSGSIPKTAS
jgi:transcriptional regulator with XRE-family HTH domain